YRFDRTDDIFVFHQEVGPPPRKSVPQPGLKGDEVVAFRIHIPSKVVWHNAGAGNQRRGNILVWEQPLADRLSGSPLVIEARMQTQSILYRTLWLFGATFVAVAVTFAVVIWWIFKRGQPPAVRT